MRIITIRSVSRIIWSSAVLKEEIEEDVEWIKGEIIVIKATLEKVTEKVGVD